MYAIHNIYYVTGFAKTLHLCTQWQDAIFTAIRYIALLISYTN